MRLNVLLRVKFIKISLFLASLMLASLAYAIAPVVDAYDDAPSSPSDPANTPPPARSDAPSRVPSNAASFSLEQRVTILERQITNLNPVLVQMDDLQQQLQTLQGKIEAQQHSLKALEEQLRSQYLAVEKRLGQRLTANSYSQKSIAAPIANTSPNTVNESMADSSKSISRHADAAPTAASERAYQAAFQFLKNKQYNEAIESFDSFVKKYPADLNVSNADYFLGQLYLLQGQPELAINFFKRFTTRYTQDARIPDALLQLGLAYFAKGNKEMATETFEKIVQQYPDSKVAQAAQARLQQFKAMTSAANLATKDKV
jgi:tol-pal system protein YbgF